MIHDPHNALPGNEKSALEESADSQERIVLKILRGKPDKPFAYFDIKKLTGWDMEISDMGYSYFRRAQSTVESLAWKQVAISNSFEALEELFF